MKNQSIVLIFLLITLVNYAQIGVGPDKYFVSKKVDDFNEESLKKLKASKTVFLYGEKDDPKVLEETIKSVWTLTEISLLPYEAFDSINFDSTSIFSIEETDASSLSINLQLWMQNTGKRGKITRESYCQIRLHVNDLIKITDDLHGIRNNLKSKKAENTYAYFYSENRFKNLDVGMLKNYLKNVNDILEESKTLSPLEKVKDNSELNKLKTQTIHIPEYAAIDYSPITGVYKNISAENVNKMLNKYPYKYVIISNEILNEKIFESPDPIYYMSFVRTSSSKQITIYNSVTGEIVYNVYDLASYNLDNSDFKDLMKAVDSFD